MSQKDPILHVDPCDRPPSGWHCTREHNHPGPCAALPDDGSPEPMDAETAYAEGITARQRSAVRRSSPYESNEHRPLARAWHDGWNVENQRCADGQKKGTA